MNHKRRFRVPKSRSTAKKPKFLSLSRQFPPGAAVNKAGSLSNKAEEPPPQIDLVVESQEHDENVAYFFSAGDGSAASLTGLLDGAAESNSSHATDGSSRRDDFSASKHGEETAALVRNALRSRERESSEEKWVCYSEVVERKVVKEEEVSSSVADLWWRGAGGEDPVPLSLKLDYEDVVKAWSGRGPLYVETTQMVPDIADDTYLSNNGVKTEEVNMGWWRVPEMGDEVEEDENDETLGEMMRLKLGQREASLLRYKAKRQNRLFSKKIRYQVRKLNAEKRPRIKGRFVKRG